MVLAQLDELSIRLTGAVSKSVLRLMERIIKQVVDHVTKSKFANVDIVRSKKKQICDTLCKEYLLAA